MRRLARWLLGILIVLVLLPVVAVALLLAGLNTPPGRRLVAREFASITSGQIVLIGVHGTLPGALRADRVELRDEHGTWAVFQDAALDWALPALLSGDARFTRLAARSGSLLRLPVSSNSSASTSTRSGGSRFPVRVDFQEIHVDRLDVQPAVAGAATSLTLDGSLHAVSLRDGELNALLRSIDNTGSYHLRGHIDPDAIRAALHVAETPGGFVARAAHLPDLGTLSITAALDGPWNRAGTQLAVAAGPLAADAHGTLDLRGGAADLDVAARAPKMAPAPGIAFQDVALNAHLHGPFSCAGRDRHAARRWVAGVRRGRGPFPGRSLRQSRRGAAACHGRGAAHSRPEIRTCSPAIRSC